MTNVHTAVFCKTKQKKLQPKCKLPLVVLVNAVYGLGQVLDCTMNMVNPSGAKGIPGANQLQKA